MSAPVLSSIYMFCSNWRQGCRFEVCHENPVLSRGSVALPFPEGFRTPWVGGGVRVSAKIGLLKKTTIYLRSKRKVASVEHEPPSTRGLTTRTAKGGVVLRDSNGREHDRASAALKYAK